MRRTDPNLACFDRILEKSPLRVKICLRRAGSQAARWVLLTLLENCIHDTGERSRQFASPALPRDFLSCSHVYVICVGFNHCGKYFCLHVRCFICQTIPVLCQLNNKICYVCDMIERVITDVPPKAVD